MGRRRREEPISGPEAEAMERYYRSRERGAEGPRVLNGPRMRAKAAQGWNGARFSVYLLGVGLLFCAAGVALPLIAFLVAAPGVWPVTVIARGAWLLGLGLMITLGHPVKVMLARRRWRSWRRMVDVPATDAEQDTAHEESDE